MRGRLAMRRRCSRLVMNGIANTLAYAWLEAIQGIPFSGIGQALVRLGYAKEPRHVLRGQGAEADRIATVTHAGSEGLQRLRQCLAVVARDTHSGASRVSLNTFRRGHKLPPGCRA